MPRRRATKTAHEYARPREANRSVLDAQVRRVPAKPQCTTGKERGVSRWEREDVLDAMRERLDRRPEMMRLRRDTVEHPFGTLKRWMGAEHFLTRGLHNVGTEMSLQVLSYNIKRVINIMGVEALVRALYALFIALCLLFPYFSVSYAAAKAY